VLSKSSTKFKHYSSASKKIDRISAKKPDATVMGAISQRKAISSVKPINDNKLNIQAPKKKVKVKKLSQFEKQVYKETKQDLISAF
jgi:hypothetical protein